MIADLAATARRSVVLLTSLALLALALLAVQQGVAPTEAAAAPATSATTTSSSHPYSDPEWFPLRRPADIGCAKTACGRYDAHGYWSIDWIGRKGDPVYAAGAGVLHVGGRGNGCMKKGSVEVEGGNWVWIDHGAGVVSRYHHLDTITARDGQLVTPATRIGTMGHSGDVQPCTINYLHFEVRHGGVKGKRVDPGELRACTSRGVRTLPAALGGKGWDDPKVHTRPRIKTPSLNGDCISATWFKTPTNPTVSLKRGTKSIDVRWSTPGPSVSRIELSVQIYRPSQGRYDQLRYVSATAGHGRYTLTGLENGRKYRIAGMFRNGHGVSKASASHKATPAGRPSAPQGLRYLTWPKRDYVHYGWNRPKHNGSPVTSFTVSARCKTSKGDWGAWRHHHQRVEDAYYNIRGLKAKKYTTCQVKVRGNSAVGSGAWSKKHTIRWRG